MGIADPAGAGDEAVGADAPCWARATGTIAPIAKQNTGATTANRMVQVRRDRDLPAGIDHRHGITITALHQRRPVARLSALRSGGVR